MVDVHDPDSDPRQVAPPPGYFPVWSPDGTRIAYIDGNHGLWVVDADGFDPRQVAPAPAFAPLWSSDGTMLSYTDQEAGAWVIVDVTNPDNRQLTSVPWVAEWDPNGASFLYRTQGSEIWMVVPHGHDPPFVRYEERRSPDNTGVAYHDEGVIWVQDVDGSNKRQLTAASELFHYYNPVWSPDGAKIAYTGNLRGGIWVVEGFHTSEYRVTNDNGFQPAWSPDGTRIAYTSVISDIGTLWLPGALRTEVRVTDTNGTWTRKVADNGSDPAWSPDGALIAFCDVDGLWVVGADGSDQQRLLADGCSFLEPISWSPDGTRIIYINDESDYWVVDDDGSNHRYVTTYAYEPTWSSGGAQIAYGSPEGIWIENGVFGFEWGVGNPSVVGGGPP